MGVRNSDGAIVHPCLTPLLISNHWDRLLRHRVRTFHVPTLRGVASPSFEVGSAVVRLTQLASGAPVCALLGNPRDERCGMRNIWCLLIQNTRQKVSSGHLPRYCRVVSWSFRGLNPLSGLGRLPAAGMAPCRIFCLG